MKKLFLMMTLLYTLSLCAWCEEGTTFIAQTPEGCSMTFTVISEKEKTVCVGNESEPAIDSETKGKITIPAIVNGYKVTRIGVRAFVQCDQIEEIVIPEGITSIGSTAFHSCEKLQSMNIPEGVKSIGTSAFAWCEELKSVTIPSTVTDFGSWIFIECRNLRSVYSGILSPSSVSMATFSVNFPDLPDNGTDVFDPEELYNDATLYVPKGCKEIYRKTNGWNLFASIVEKGKPFIQDGKRWNYIGYLSGVDSEHERSWKYSYYLRGDTVVGDISCLKLYYEGGQNNLEEQYKGAMYEKEGKVYFIPKGNTVSKLLYDFSCHVGDKLDTYSGMIVVEKVQSVRYQKEEYKTISVQDMGLWIEGIGSVYDLFTLAIPNPGEGAELVSCELNGKVIFDYEDFLKEKVDPYGKNPKMIELTDRERQLVENNNDFAFRLFGKARGDESLLLSPLSITFDLGMLNNAADGVTREEIDAVLGSKDVGGADVINSFCRKLLDESGTLDERTRVSIANNIYVNSAAGYELYPSFVETARQYYDAMPESRDFDDGKTRDVINQWGSDHTEGMIEEAIKESEFNPNAVSYLLNALYFKGEWTHKFNDGETRLCPFDSGRAEAQLMHQVSDFNYAETETYQSIILPYGNMAYQMTVFLPCSGKTIDDVLEQLNGKNWQQDDYGSSQVNLMLPRFETETDLFLEDIMKDLGMTNAFEGGCGFDKFGDGNFYISMMKQVAKIRLDEEGTEAAAVTVIEMEGTSVPNNVDFIADHPFLYVISESSTGSIFFIGQYMGETPTVGIASPTQPTSSASGDVMYNLAGQRLNVPPLRGIYIRNGKKVFVP